MNVELLRRVQDHILEEPKRMIMNHWCLTGKDISQDGLAVPDCQTVGCISGWAAVLSGIPITSSAVYERADLLGIKNNICDDGSPGQRLFYVSNWPIEFQMRIKHKNPQTLGYARVVADRIDHFIATEGRE